ncbi:alpha/beta hydrolase family protein [Evansella tamaricis]|uniref:Alpha/beta fold hydrolase n=1 Tax=Evansella tamaricis TaxID=2069301 RepID=A0ABS6JAH5_9BACI|nr:alpha/beta fold hydrolase [Evansella tamaricis]MBU9710546.1 alpha/beta fold hydrolase [Evansella tamaricis]
MHKLEQGESVNIKMKDGITLNGHLFKPDGLTEYPLMIFVNGSGVLPYEVDLQEENFYFCSTLLNCCMSEGFALLLVNKRGVGSSEGNWKKQSFFDRADDIHTVILAMRERDDIMEKHISVSGHSQGGWVVQLLASRYPDLLKSALSIAGPAYSVMEQITDNMDTILIQKGYPRLVKWMRPISKLSLTSYLYLSKIVKLGYLSHIIDYDARETIPNIKVPIYFAFAENDELVPLEHNEPLAQELIGGRSVPYKISIAPGVNHSFARSEKYQTWDEIESKASPELVHLFKDFCRWTRENFL